MQDRLHELYANQTPSDFNEAEMVEVPIDIDLLDVPAGLQDFTDKVDKLKLDMTQLKSNIETLNSGLRSLLLTTDITTQNNQEDLNRNLENQIEEQIRTIGSKIKELNAENQAANDHTRWRNNVHSHLTKRFMDLLLQYRGTQAEYRDKIQERIRQRLQIVKPDATQEEVQRVANGGKLNVFAPQLYNENSEQAKDALNYVEGRHRELIKIEQSVNELHQLFNDMAILVNAQGDFIDNIEANVAQTSAFVVEANQNLVEARKRKSRSRWCKCAALIVCLVLLGVGIALFIFFGAANNWWKSVKP